MSCHSSWRELRYDRAMRWSKSIFFTLVLLLTVPGFAQPSLRDILQVGGALQQRRGSSDLEQAIRLGGVIIQMTGRGDYQLIWTKTAPRDKTKNFPTLYTKKSPRNFCVARARFWQI